MALKYFKRYRMEIDLIGRDHPFPDIPHGYQLVPWDPELVEIHAETKYLSFRAEIDANVFPCLGELDGCQRLMREISRKEGFLPCATWLIRTTPPSPAAPPGHGGEQPADYYVPEYCGTIQGIGDLSGLGAVQNLGVTPEHRGRGLGVCLLLAALAGFRSVGLKRAFLEVTAQNEGAIRLYRRLGFVRARTVYKAAEVAYGDNLVGGGL